MTLILTYVVKIMTLKDFQQILTDFHLPVAFIPPFSLAKGNTILISDSHPLPPASGTHNSHLRLSYFFWGRRGESHALLKQGGGEGRWKSYIPEAERRGKDESQR